MTPFEFVFPLFGLLIGLSYAEILGGLARALKAPGRVRIGWLTPLLGTFLLVNLTMFWSAAWAFRDTAMPGREGLLQMLAISGAYYLAASLLFPAEIDKNTKFDAHVMDNKKVALLAIGLCNGLGLALFAAQRGWRVGPEWWIINGVFLAVLIATALTKSPRLALAGLAAMLAAHGVALLFG